MTHDMTAGMSTGQFAQLVAEIEVAELERGAAIAPVFLWLWEHRVQVRGLLTAGTSWVALAGALGRIGLGDARGAAPSVEHCRAAWGRVVAFEPLVAGRSLARVAPAHGPALPGAVAEASELVPATASPASPTVDVTRFMDPPVQLPEATRFAPAATAPGVSATLGGILRERRRATLADPPPLDLAAKDRRPRRESSGDVS